MPSEARAYINYRIHPAHNIDSVIKYMRDAVNDERISIKVVESFAPSKVTDYSADAMPFQVLINSALEVIACINIGL